MGGRGSQNTRETTHVAKNLTGAIPWRDKNTGATGGGGGGSNGGGSRATDLPIEILPEIASGAKFAVVHSAELNLGGATYPFLESLGRPWAMTAWDTDQPEPLSQEIPTFGATQPTLRWVGDGKCTDLYVEGMDTAEFLAHSGLAYNLHKGPYVLSKRISRVMRPHFLATHFEQNEVAIQYQKQTPDEAKIWDGAGVVSREMLRRISLNDQLTPQKRKELEAEIAHTQRVEFTIMTAKGQDKGHAMVADDLRDANGNPIDFLLPEDTKKEVKLTNGKTFVGITPVHGKNHMRLDVQSLINLTPFFDRETLAGYLEDEGKLFTQSILSGEIADVMGRIDEGGTLEDAAAWPMKEFFARGGHPLWFRAHVKNLADQHLERLNHSTLEKFRLPIPGGRHYVMPAAVGVTAGFDIDVPRGQIEIDAKRGTAWVNDEDWVQMQGSETGISGILGGADNDDALWVYGFTDHDEQEKIIVWRSPNQEGEYVVLEPSLNSHDLTWKTAEGHSLSYPPSDSRLLPPRTDTVSVAYQKLIDPNAITKLPADTPYSIEVMTEAIQQSIQNQGVLGMYCNMIMVEKAVYDRLPENPPAPLEDVIDSAVKTGADLSPVREWCYKRTMEIVAEQTAVPTPLQHRLCYPPREPDQPPIKKPTPTVDHWVDLLTHSIQAHIKEIEEAKQEFLEQAMPPAQLFAYAFAPGREEALQLGIQFNQTNGRPIAVGIQAVKKNAAQKIKTGKKSNMTGREMREVFLQQEEEIGRVIQQSRQSAEKYLEQFPPEMQEEIIIGAMAHAYIGNKSDALLWAKGEKDAAGNWQPGLGHLTNRALVKLGILKSETADENYQGVKESSSVMTVGIQYAWFEIAKNRAQRTGKPVPEKMSDVPIQERKELKKIVKQSAEKLTGQTVIVTHENGQLWAKTEAGQVVGRVPDKQYQDGDELRIQATYVDDGSIRAICRPAVEKMYAISHGEPLETGAILTVKKHEDLLYATTEDGEIVMIPPQAQSETYQEGEKLIVRHWLQRGTTVRAMVKKVT